MIRILKNPTSNPIEVMYDGRITIFNPLESKPVEEGVAKLALEFKNTPLIDITDLKEEIVVSKPSGEVTEPNQNSELALMKLPQLLKLAKSKGLKVKFGMKRTEVISLLING
jgi:hypothetical protein